EADIIAVKGGDFSFSTADIIAGIQYIFARADQLGRPAVVNLSLGTLFGPHDGTEAEEQAIDALSGPGHIVVIAAGNDGSNPTATTGNTPFFLVHATRTLAAVGDTAQIGDTVPPYTPATGDQNHFWVITLRLDQRGGSGRFDLWEYATSSSLGNSQISSGGDNGYLVGSPGNAARAITVAAHVNRVNWTAQAGRFQFLVREQVGDLATFSSSGPTPPVRARLPARPRPAPSARARGWLSASASTGPPPAARA